MMHNTKKQKRLELWKDKTTKMIDNDSEAWKFEIDKQDDNDNTELHAHAEHAENSKMRKWLKNDEYAKQLNKMTCLKLKEHCENDEQDEHDSKYENDEDDENAAHERHNKYIENEDNKKLMKEMQILKNTSMMKKRWTWWKRRRG